MNELNRLAVSGVFLATRWMQESLLTGITTVTLFKLYGAYHHMIELKVFRFDPEVGVTGYAAEVNITGGAFDGSEFGALVVDDTPEKALLSLEKDVIKWVVEAEKAANGADAQKPQDENNGS